MVSTVAGSNAGRSAGAVIREAFDAAIVGAGPAGAATARWLALQGKRVALVEQSRFDAPRVGESLAPAVQPLLVELGVWTEFLGLKPMRSYGTLSNWGEGGPRIHSHMMNPWGCGWHVDRLAFDRMLADAAATSGAELQLGTAPLRCEVTDDGQWLLRIGDRTTGCATLLRARVLVDATGRPARMARWVGAHRIAFDRLVGVAILHGCMDTSPEGYIQVETTADGWWYSAPVPCNRMMAMLMTDSDLCKRAQLLSVMRWRNLLAYAPATGARIDGTVLWGPRVFPAHSQRLGRGKLDAPWIAVGDAALAVDPISGSGVVRALRSARLGAETALALIGGQTRRAIQAYEAECDLECTAYLQERALYYGVERRWQESAFWQRRGVVANPTKERRISTTLAHQ